MTEAEWLASKDPRMMLWGLRGLTNLRNRRNGRKLRLFAVACCQRIRHLLAEADAVRALDLAEEYADGQASEPKMLASSALVARMHAGVWDAYQAVCKASSRKPTYTFRRQYVDGPDYLAACAVWRSTLWEEIKTNPDPPHQERPNAVALAAKTLARETQADILRCVFGNPFRPLEMDPTWRTSSVVALAHAAYDERRLPSRELIPLQLAVLADALEDAGCSEVTILEHLRGGVQHTRGCWALDLVLGKS